MTLSQIPLQGRRGVKPHETEPVWTPMKDHLSKVQTQSTEANFVKMEDLLHRGHWPRHTYAENGHGCRNHNGDGR